MNWVSVKVKCQGCVKKIKALVESATGLLGMRARGLEIELRSDQDLSNILNQFPKSAQISRVEQRGARWSLQFKLFFTSTLVVVLLMLLEFIWATKLTIATPLYLVALLILIIPELNDLKWSAFKTFVPCAFATALVLLVLPLALMVKVAFSFAMFSMYAYRVLQSHAGKGPSMLSSIGVFIYSMASIAISCWISPIFWCTAPVPMMFATLKVRNTALNCDWSLKVVASLVFLVSAITYTLSLPAMVCMHEAFIAVWLLKIKGMQLESIQASETHLEYIEPGVLGQDMSIKAADSNLRVSLEKCDFDWCVTHLLKRGVPQQHEGVYTLDQFRVQCLPKNARILEGNAIAEPSKFEGLHLNTSEHNQLDVIASKLVPLSLMFATCVFSIAMMGSLGIATAFGMAASTLLASCPCVFLMLYFMESAVEALFVHHGMNVKVNFQKRCLEGLSWPDFSKWMHVFDRTGVTHGPSDWSKSQRGFDFNAQSLQQKKQHLLDGLKQLGESIGSTLSSRFMGGVEEYNEQEIDRVYRKLKDEYVFYEDAYAYMKQLKGAEADVLGLSAAQEREESYRTSMEDIGITVDVDRLYQKASKKSDAFQRIRGDDYTIMYGDGLNDSKIFDLDKVCGVAVRECADEIKDKAVCWLHSFKDARRVLAVTIEGQRFAGKLAKQGFIYNIFAMLFGVVFRVFLGIIVPMWTPCVLVLISMASMRIQIHFKIKALNAKYFEQIDNSGFDSKDAELSINAQEDNHSAEQVIC